MYSVTQGGLDLQQVTGPLFLWIDKRNSAEICSHTLLVNFCTLLLWNEFQACRALSESRGVVWHVQIYTVHHLALETTAERKAAAIVLPCHKSYNPS